MAALRYRGRAGRQRGVSLIEALVALAVTAFGMLAIVGVQATLRFNADVSKQRSEAVRIAQEAVEEWRAFTRMETTSGVTDFADITSSSAVEVTGYTTNTIYWLDRTVDSTADPRMKTLRVTVRWADRTSDGSNSASTNQAVELNSIVTGMPPAAAGTLSLAPAGGAPVRQPRGRHAAIPATAVQLGSSGKSGFIPPGAAAGVAWRFDNVTGLIETCTTTATTTAGLTVDNLSCSGNFAMLVTGFVRYALGSAQPLAADAASPPSAPATAPASNSVQVWVNRSAPSAQQVSCFVEHVNTAPFYSAYFCAVPVASATGTWSGDIYFRPDTLLASTLSVTTSDRLKACRYHAAASYTNASVPLANQNFLLIRAGNGSTAYTCSGAGLTAHQPSV